MYGSEFYTPKTIASIAADSYYKALYGVNSEYFKESWPSPLKLELFRNITVYEILSPSNFDSLLGELPRKDLASLKSALRMFTKRQIKNWENLRGVQFDTGFLKFKRNLNKELQHRDVLHKDACRATTAHQAIVAANVAVIPPTTISSCSFI